MKKMVSFRFTKEQVPSELIQNIQAINTLSEEQLSELISILLGFLTRENNEDLMESVRVFAENQGANPNALKNVVTSLLYFFKGSIRSNLTPGMLSEDLLNFGIKEERASVISTIWKEKFVSLSKTVIGSTLMVNQLVDMDWKFGITAANSDTGKVGTSYLQLKLVLDKGILLIHHYLMSL